MGALKERKEKDRWIEGKEEVGEWKEGWEGRHSPKTLFITTPLHVDHTYKTEQFRRVNSVVQYADIVMMCTSTTKCTLVICAVFHVWSITISLWHFADYIISVLTLHIIVIFNFEPLRYADTHSLCGSHLSWTSDDMTVTDSHTCNGCFQMILIASW